MNMENIFKSSLYYILSFYLYIILKNIIGRINWKNQMIKN